MGVKIFEWVAWILLCLLALKGFCGFWLHVHEFACPCVSLVSFKSSEVQILVKPLPIFLQNAWWEHNNTDSRLKLCMSASLFCSSFSEYPSNARWSKYWQMRSSVSGRWQWCFSKHAGCNAFKYIQHFIKWAYCITYPESDKLICNNPISLASVEK